MKRVGIDDIAAGSVSDSTMYRVGSRNGLCLPAKDTAVVRQAAGVRREAFVDPPSRRNRHWHGDFSEFETAGGGRWNLGGVVDYWAKVNLAALVTIRKTTSDAIDVLAPCADFFDIDGLRSDLGDLLGAEVDVIDAGGLKPDKDAGHRGILAAAVRL